MKYRINSVYERNLYYDDFIKYVEGDIFENYEFKVPEGTITIPGFSFYEVQPTSAAFTPENINTIILPNSLERIEANTFLVKNKLNWEESGSMGPYCYINISIPKDIKNIDQLSFSTTYGDSGYMTYIRLLYRGTKEEWLSKNFKFYPGYNGKVSVYVDGERIQQFGG